MTACEDCGAAKEHPTSKTKLSNQIRRWIRQNNCQIPTPTLREWVELAEALEGGTPSEASEPPSVLSAADTLAECARRFAGDVGAYREHPLWDAIEAYENARAATPDETDDKYPLDRTECARLGSNAQETTACPHGCDEECADCCSKKADTVCQCSCHR